MISDVINEHRAQQYIINIIIIIVIIIIIIIINVSRI